MAVAFDEMKGTDGAVRPAYRELATWLGEIRPDVLDYRRREAELLFRRIGITFAVYGEADSQERLIPFDVIPRILAGEEWRLLQRGLEQRVKAINAYIRDVYGKRDCLRAGIIPEDLVFQNPVFRPEMNGQKVPHNIYVHIAGIDVVRVDAEDLLRARGQCAHALGRLLHAREPRDHAAAVSRAVRAPSRRAGRQLSGRIAGDALVGRARFLAARSRPSCCSRPASSTRPITNTRSSPTSSASNSSRGAISSSRMKSSICARRKGRKRVDVIYRRLDDDFLDPLAFRPDSALGVPGLMSAYQAGNVTLANAVGTGVADDKAVYSYMPDIIKFFLGEEPLLKNVPTWRCREEKHLAYVLDNYREPGREGGSRLRRLRHADRTVLRQVHDCRVQAPR